jgi:hypothetical protein
MSLTKQVPLPGPILLTEAETREVTGGYVEIPLLLFLASDSGSPPRPPPPPPTGCTECHK